MFLFRVKNMIFTSRWDLTSNGIMLLCVHRIILCLHRYMCALSSSYLWLIASPPNPPPPRGCVYECVSWWLVRMMNLLTSWLHGSRRDEVSSCGCWPVALKAHHSALTVVPLNIWVRDRQICEIIVKLIMGVCLCVHIQAFVCLCLNLFVLCYNLEYGTPCFCDVKTWNAWRRCVHGEK